MLWEAWAWSGRPGPGGQGVRTYGRTDGRTKYPLHSTEHRPFGAAAQKGEEEKRNYDFFLMAISWFYDIIFHLMPLKFTIFANSFGST